MAAQKSEAINQTPQRQKWISLKLPDGPLPMDIANLPDNPDMAYLERTWKKPLFHYHEQSDEKEILERALGRPPFKGEVNMQGFWLYLHRGNPPGLASSPQEALLKFRDTLRRAWKGEQEALATICLVAQVGTGWHIDKGQLELFAVELWGVPCVTFLRDFAAGKMAVCANPDCSSPYFIRSRRTQKVCDVAACKVHSHKISALHWWNTKGRRKKKGKK